MANPQQQLYKMLAEGAARGRDAQRIHKAAMQRVPAMQQANHDELTQLREQIQSAGVGKDPEAEDRYLELLKHRRRLEQLAQMNQELTTVSPEDTPLDEPLQKALDYGNLLLSIYGPGVLVKAAGADLMAHAATLRQFENDHADALAQELENAASYSG